MPCRTQRRFSALSANSFARIKVNCRENAYFVHSELSPSPGKCTFERIKIRKTQGRFWICKYTKKRLQKLQFTPIAHILSYLAFETGKAYTVRTCLGKLCTKLPKGVSQSSFLALNFTSAGILQNWIQGFFLLYIFFFLLYFPLHSIFSRKGNWKLQNCLLEIHEHLVNFRGMNHSPG